MKLNRLASLTLDKAVGVREKAAPVILVGWDRFPCVWWSLTGQSFRTPPHIFQRKGKFV